MEGEFCSIDGLDLAILAHAALHPGKRLGPELQHPKRLAKLRRLGLLQSERQGLTWVHSASSFGNAAAALLDDRPGLAKELATPTHLTILASLHALTNRSLPISRSRLAWLTAASPTTFRSALGGLTESNLVLEPKGDLVLNPDLPALHAFLNALQAECALPPSSLQPATTIHSAGLEAAWRTPAREAEGLQAVATQPAFQHILQPYTIHYRGPRRLDRWDHAFLFLLGDARRLANEIQPSARLKAAVMALMSPKLALNEQFAWRASYYGLSEFSREARQVLTTQHPFQEFIRDMRSRFDAQEGWLNAPR